MKTHNVSSKYFSVVVCATGAVFGASIANADQIVGADSAASSLKSCLVQHLANEKAKDNPKANALLTKCQSEADAFFRTVPPELLTRIEDFLVNDVQAQLDKK